MNKVSSSVLSVIILGALVTACAASTGADDEATGSTSQADSTCGVDLNASVTNTYVNEACHSFIQNSAGSVNTSYSSDANCPDFVAMWNGTTANNTGLFTVAVSATTSTISEALCNGATLSASAYGLEDYVNGIYSYSSWIPLGTAINLTRGQWSAGQCVLTGTISFSDTVPAPSPDDLRRYQDIKVSAQATYPYTGLRPVGSHWVDYLPVSLTLSQQGC